MELAVEEAAARSSRAADGELEHVPPELNSVGFPGRSG